MVAVVVLSRSAPILFWDFLMVGLPWHLGVRWTWRMVLCLDPGRSNQRLNVVFGLRTANETNEAAFDEGSPQRPTSVEYSISKKETLQPFHESVHNPLARVSETTRTPSEPFSNGVFAVSGSGRGQPVSSSPHKRSGVLPSRVDMSTDTLPTFW